MVRTGIVKSKKGDMLRVCFETPEHCAGCRGCSRGFLPKHELLTVFGQAEVGAFDGLGRAGDRLSGGQADGKKPSPQSQMAAYSDCRTSFQYGKE